MVGVSKELTRSLVGRRWYHQRFDGSPLFLSFIADAELKPEPRKPVGSTGTVRVTFFERGAGDWYIPQTDIDAGSRELVRRARHDSNISAKLLKAWERDEAVFEHFFWQEFPRINRRRLSNGDLLELWQRYRDLALARLTSSSVIDHFALGTDELISRQLRREAEARIGRLKESDFVEIFSVATAPAKQSFINQAEIDLLDITTGRSKESLSRYQRRYFWTKNNYVDANVLTVAHFRHEIGVWRQGGKDLRAVRAKIAGTPATNRRRKAVLVRRLRLSPHLRTLLTISEDFTWWQDERKRATYLNIHLGCQILEEIGRRISYPLEPLKYLLPSEVSLLFDRRERPGIAELRQRERHCAVIFTAGRTTVYTGPAVDRLRRRLFGRTAEQTVDDFRGLSASMGKAVGRVKILKSSREVAKIAPGDVLVAVMTRPDYVPAMRKAAAIVTNEGGITSHAAIVSRELGIPCIIGTKIATEVLKDGDLVEVNANHGWVRKLK